MADLFRFDFSGLKNLLNVDTQNAAQYITPEMRAQVEKNLAEHRAANADTYYALELIKEMNSRLRADGEKLKATQKGVIFSDAPNFNPWYVPNSLPLVLINRLKKQTGKTDNESIIAAGVAEAKNRASANQKQTLALSLTNEIINANNAAELLKNKNPVTRPLFSLRGKVGSATDWGKVNQTRRRHGQIYINAVRQYLTDPDNFKQPFYPPVPDEPKRSDVGIVRELKNLRKLAIPPALLPVAVQTGTITKAEAMQVLGTQLQLVSVAVPAAGLLNAAVSTGISGLVSAATKDYAIKKINDEIEKQVVKHAGGDDIKDERRKIAQIQRETGQAIEKIKEDRAQAVAAVDADTAALIARRDAINAQRLTPEQKSAIFATIKQSAKPVIPLALAAYLFGA